MAYVAPVSLMQTVAQNLHVRDNVVGFDEDLMKLKNQLCDEEQPQLQIIPIVGMEGIGKTTLAMSIYDDPYVKYHFPIRGWALSQQYLVRDILLSLLDNIAVVTDDILKVRDEELEEYFYKNLKGRRYLIVVDDVLSKEAWNEIQRLFPNDHNGSRIILTTRLTDVADYVSSSNPCHQMHLLDEESSWYLFLDRVFGQEICPTELVDVGKRIAKNCRGLPLTIVIIGDLLLRNNKEQVHWYAVEKFSSVNADDLFSRCPQEAESDDLFPIVVDNSQPSTPKDI